MSKKSPMVRLRPEQIEKKINFIRDYVGASNAATGSILDANANVAQKNVATLHSEMHKDINIQINRALMRQQIASMFGEGLAEEYTRQLEDHELYCHDETNIYPYCVSVSMYPFLLNGMVDLGGESKAPKHFESYCGSFINLVFAISSQFAGAVATVEFLMHFDYFARKDFGPNYLETHEKKICAGLQHVVYSLNQPAAARGFQCVKEDTELLTPEGYKRLGDLRVGDECYTWDNGQLKKEKIQRLNVYDFDGELMEFSGRGFKQTVTPNHRVVYKSTAGCGYKIAEAEKVFGHSKLSIPIAANNEFEDYPISDDMLKLLVFALTDGSIDDARLTVYKSPNRWGYSELQELLTRNGIGYTLGKTDVGAFGEVGVFRIPKADAAIILRPLKYTKKEVPFFFTLLSQRQARIVLETWSNLDGMWQDGRPRMQCDNEAIADRLQHVAFLAGFGSTIERPVFNSFSGTKTEGLYVKTFVRDAKRVSKYTLVPYKGKVWCPTTETGVVVFREAGTPYISGNSVFWNISVFDEPYFKGIFDGFVYPGTDDRPDYASVKRLQAYFLRWFSEERERSLLTFPVVTAALLCDANAPVDTDFANMLSSELAAGNSFFIYQSDSADSLASCCRVRNQLLEKPEFSYTLGAGGVATGSVNVMTLNMNRLVQDGRDLKTEMEKLHKYQLAYREIVKTFLEAKMLPAYDAGFIHLEKQYSTAGIMGFVEAAEFLGIEPGNNEQYKGWVAEQLQIIYDANREATKKYGVPFNTEMVPGESLGVKFAQWDKKDGYKVNRDCYNSYFYKVEDPDTDPFDKFVLHGKEIVQYLDGGSALHLNLDCALTSEQYYNLLCLAAKTGCNYWTVNVRSTCCESCGYIDKETTLECVKCGSTDLTYATRVIGYLKKVSSFSEDRQKEHAKRMYHADR